MTVGGHAHHIGETYIIHQQRLQQGGLLASHGCFQEPPAFHMCVSQGLAVTDLP